MSRIGRHRAESRRRLRQPKFLPYVASTDKRQAVAGAFNELPVPLVLDFRDPTGHDGRFTSIRVADAPHKIDIAPFATHGAHVQIELISIKRMNRSRATQDTNKKAGAATKQRWQLPTTCEFASHAMTIADSFARMGSIGLRSARKQAIEQRTRGRDDEPRPRH